MDEYFPGWWVIWENSQKIYGPFEKEEEAWDYAALQNDNDFEIYFDEIAGADVNLALSKWWNTRKKGKEGSYAN